MIYKPVDRNPIYRRRKNKRIVDYGETTKYYNKLSSTVERHHCTDRRSSKTISFLEVILYNYITPPATAALVDWGMTLKGRIFAYCKYTYDMQRYITVSSIIYPCLYIYYDIIYTHVPAAKHLWVANQFVSRFFRSRYAYFQWRSATGCTRGMYVYTRYVYYYH